MAPFVISDLKGLNGLVRDITEEVVDLVEDMHAAIAVPMPFSDSGFPRRTGGIPGLVYRCIRGVTRLISAGTDAVLSGAAPLIGEPPPLIPAREAVLAVLNGIRGDLLTDSDNPIAIRMSFRQDGRTLALERDELTGALPHVTSKLLILIHGLCMNDLQWTRAGHNHGTALQRDLGYTPVYLHYNSGLHISTNGRELNSLLEALVREWPQPVDEVVMIGHSMGGLVARSACYYAAESSATWLSHLRTLIFLGVPHHGSPLERVGNWVDGALGATRYTAPFRHLGRRRGAGITDLRYGSIVDEDWQGLDRFANMPNAHCHVPLPEGVVCHAFAASRGKTATDLKGRLLGDDMVPVDSALGWHSLEERNLLFPESQQWIGYNLSHLDLLCDCEVYEQIRSRLAKDA